jgi:hypothetical protein
MLKKSRKIEEISILNNVTYFSKGYGPIEID